MNQDHTNIQVKIDNLLNRMILQVVINRESQSPLYKEENTKLSPENIDKILPEHLSAIGLEETQILFPNYKSHNNLSLSPKDDLLQSFQLFREEVIHKYKNQSCLIDEFYALCDSYYKKAIVSPDYITRYVINSFQKCNEIDSWLCHLWTNKKYSLENIRLYIERLSLYCLNKMKNAYADSNVTKKRIEEKNMLETIDIWTQVWKRINVITRNYKEKRVLDPYTSTLSDYYLHQLQIESNNGISIFFNEMRQRLEKLQTTVNTIYDILSENNKQPVSQLMERETFSTLVSKIEKEHLSLSDMGMNSMTDLLNSLQEKSYPKGNERVQHLRRDLSTTLIDKHLHQLEEEYRQTSDVIIDESGVKYTVDKRMLLKAPQNLSRYYIPYGVVKIYDSAFSNATSLEYIKIPEGVCSIGKAAFQGCSKLKEITLPKSTIHIGEHAFRGCTQLEDVVFLYQYISLNEEWFDDCPTLEKERIMTSNSVLSGWIFNAENRSGIHKETGIELQYRFDNGDGTINVQMIDFLTRMEALHTQGYSREEADAIYRKVGREFTILCKSLH